jgi:regulator of sirC expression with transglutaminase-like and TPR domain
MVAGPDAAIDLARAALLIACQEYPDLEIPRYVARLDSLGAALQARLSAAPADAQVQGLNDYLFSELGFRGNNQDYYDPRNSYLNDVLDRRLGIPITLSTVYIEVGRRAGLAVEGVGLPGHFIVRVGAGGADVLVDPFHGGVRLTERDCQERLDRVYGGRVKVVPEMLAPCGRRYMLERILRNLKAIHLKADDHLRALRIVDLLLRVQPDSAEDLRDRGLLYAALECYRLAAADLDAYLVRAPATPDAAELRRTIEDLKRRGARLN